MSFRAAYIRRKTTNRLLKKLKNKETNLYYTWGITPK